MVDASALSMYVLGEEGWERVGAFVRERRPLYSVDHVLKECFNAIWKHAYLRRVIGVEVAMELAKRVLKLVETGVIVLEDESRYLPKALEIALRYGVTLYDALYIAQALEHGELLTCDTRQATVAQSLGVRVYLI